MTEIEQENVSRQNVEMWDWWVGHDDERYHTKCTSREQAVKIAQDQNGGWICKARPPRQLKLSQLFDVDDFLERAEENAQADEGDPDGGSEIFDPTRDQIADLDTAIKAAIDAWQIKHGLLFSGWSFSDMRTPEYIPSAPVEAQA